MRSLVRLKYVRLKYVAVAFTIIVGCCRGAQAQAPAPNNDTGAVLIRLQYVPDRGYAVNSSSFGPNAEHLGSGAMLVSIDHKNVKNLSKDQLTQLLQGPLDSTCEITYIDSQGHIETQELKRRTEKNKSYSERNQIMISNYDDRSDRNWNGGFVMDSLDLEARASQNLVMREAVEAYPPNPQGVSIAAFNNACRNYELGSLNDGDNFLKTSFMEYQPNQRLGAKSKRTANEVDESNHFPDSN